MPSLREGIPAALLEAMALRVPVVASRAGGMPEIVEDGVNGYLVEPGNWREISERVLELLGNREKRALFAEKGSKTVRERFDVSRTVRELERVFVRILGKDE
jgi:glycosyltransferase involved in cell wall biosynthesis